MKTVFFATRLNYKEQEDDEVGVWWWRKGYFFIADISQQNDGLVYLSHVMRKPVLCICENKDADQLRSNCAVIAQLISAFVFITWIIQSLYFPNPKFHASRNILWLYSQVNVGPGRKPRRPIFSQRGSFYSYNFYLSPRPRNS